MEMISSKQEETKYILELSAKRTDFQPVSKDVSVFYDESNKHVSLSLCLNIEVNWFCLRFSL